jgi:O-methyltransferase
MISSSSVTGDRIGTIPASDFDVQKEFEALRNEVTQLRSQVTALEQRFATYYRERFNCIDKLADYLVGAQLPGDYFEFGVSRGVTFSYAMRIMQELFPQMSFIALDSFEGLPAPSGQDAVQGYTSGFQAGEFACSREDFLANVAAAGGDVSRIKTVPGWFDRSLVKGAPDIAGLGKLAAAWIDCDLYESTVPVLDFLTDRLSVGSVLLFDDWRCFRNLPDRGEQRACREWLERNPQIALREFVDFGFHGVSFTVERC